MAALLASRPVVSLPLLRSRVSSRRSAAIVAQSRPSTSNSDDLQAQLTKIAAVSTAASTFLAAGNAQAAQEVAGLAAADGRLGAISLLLLPALGWVGFNILGPAQNQMANMSGKTSKARSVAAGLGLTAALMLAQDADAAQEITSLAAGDNRAGLIFFVFFPVVAWVLFNILGPALNQLDNMQGGKKAKRGVAAAIGAGASMLAIQQADAASEIAQVAAGDNRGGLILFVFFPVVAWVLFNILGPAQNQINNMTGKVPKRR